MGFSMPLPLLVAFYEKKPAVLCFSEDVNCKWQRYHFDNAYFEIILSLVVTLHHVIQRQTSFIYDDHVRKISNKAIILKLNIKL